jgi:hypothetical protein
LVFVPARVLEKLKVLPHGKVILRLFQALRSLGLMPNKPRRNCLIGVYMRRQAKRLEDGKIDD